MSKKITRLEDLKPDPRNANRGTPRGHAIIEGSVRARGAGRSGLAAADGTMIAGSQTLQKMAELGIPIRPVHTTGDEWVVVIRDDIEPGSEAATLLAIEDNRATELGLEWEPDILASIAGDVDLSGLFTADELADVTMPSLPDAGAGGDEFDTTPEDGPTRTALGELWQIGPHRLLVGDCTVAENVARLFQNDKAEMVWTDPPYGVAIGDKNKYLNSIAPSNRVEENLENDTLDEPALMEMLRGAFKCTAAHCLAGGAWYVAAPPGRYMSSSVRR